MKFLFRLDSSLTIGTGHVVRCLSVATELKKRGHEVDFFCNADPGNLNENIKKNGFSVKRPDQVQGVYDVALVDHYGLDHAYEKNLKQFAKKVVAIDDWGNRKHACDAIIDPSISSLSKERIAINAGISFYTGPDWLLLRSDFTELHPQIKPRTELKKVLLFFGGTDLADQVHAYLNVIQKNLPQLALFEFHILIGETHPRCEELKAMKLPPGCRLYVSPPSVAKLMAEMDVYLGSSGTISWERMCLGLTGIVVSVVDNQEDVAQTMHQMGLHYYLGRSSEVAPEIALNELVKVCSDPKKIKEMSQLCYSLVDGQGLRRMVELLENLM